MPRFSCLVRAPARLLARRRAAGAGGKRGAVKANPAAPAADKQSRVEPSPVPAPKAVTPAGPQQHAAPSPPAAGPGDRRREWRTEGAWAAAALAVFGPAFYALYRHYNRKSVSVASGEAHGDALGNQEWKSTTSAVVAPDINSALDGLADIESQPENAPTSTESDDEEASAWEEFLKAFKEGDDSKATTCRYLIVGAGPAGHAAACELASLDPGAEILLVGAEEHPPYRRPMLNKAVWVAGSAERMTASTHDPISAQCDTTSAQPDRIETHAVNTELDTMPNAMVLSLPKDAKVTLVLSTRVERIDLTTRTAMLSDGRSVSFERVLLATGSQPTVPSVFQAVHASCSAAGDLEAPLVTTLRTYDQMQQLHRRLSAPNAPRTAIVGNDFLAAEMCTRLRAWRPDLPVALVLHDAPAVLSRLLPSYLAEHVTSRIAAAGVRVISQPVVGATLNRRLDYGDAKSALEHSSGPEESGTIAASGIATAESVDLGSASLSLSSALARLWRPRAEKPKNNAAPSLQTASATTVVPKVVKEVELQFEGGERQAFDVVLVATGAAPNTAPLGLLSNIPVDAGTGGFCADANLHVADGVVYAAGDAAAMALSPGAPRRRLSFYDHATASGRHAAANMARRPRADEPYDLSALSMFSAPVPGVVLAGAGRLDPRLTTVGLWSPISDGAGPEAQQPRGDYSRPGAVLYLDDARRIVGALLVNMGARREEARAIVAENTADIAAVARRLRLSPDE